VLDKSRGKQYNFCAVKGGECSLVWAPGFKPGREALLGVSGGFDSHTPPPYFEFISFYESWYLLLVLHNHTDIQHPRGKGSMYPGLLLL